MTDILRKIRIFVPSQCILFIFVLCFSSIFVTTCCFAVNIDIASYSHDEYLNYCIHDKIEEKYTVSSCWSCDLVHSLMETMLGAVFTLQDSIIELSNLILVYGSALWLATFFLKSVSSFAEQDTAKNLDGVMTFMFKACIAYAFLYAGIEVMVTEIIVPILTIGRDISEEFRRM